MAQFRLTSKMAKKLNIISLPQPKSQVLPFYDDWVVDLLKIKRKDVVVFMHVKTRIASAIPLFEIGGAKNLLGFVPALIESTINELRIDGFEHYGCTISNYFDPDLNNIDFFKTDNRSVIAHLNQFKEILEMECDNHGQITLRVCDETITYWQKNLITNPRTKKEYTRPIDIWQSYLAGGDTNDNKNVAVDNIIPFPRVKQ